MVELKINDKIIQVPAGTTILEAARSAGFSIPSMCYLKGQSNHPSCMICVVKDRKNGSIFPSCAMPVNEGMDIISEDDEIRDMRKQSLELLLSDHVGDCEAPCQLSCPAHMDIPLMNRLIGANKFEEAIRIVKNDIALPFILGYICPAPCENACRRKQINAPVSICLLKRSTAQFSNFEEAKTKPNGKKIAIIGSGVAGLSLAYFLQLYGFSCDIFEKNKEIGGSLRYDISEEILPKRILDIEIEGIKKLGASFYCSSDFNPSFYEEKIKNRYSALIISTGVSTQDFSWLVEVDKNGIVINEKNFLTSVSNIYACGSVVKKQKMAIRTAAHAKQLANIIANIQTEKKQFNSRFAKLTKAELPEYLKESVSNNRNNSIDHLTGFSIQEAIEEAKRCLHCDCRKKDACKLRDYSTLYSAQQNSYNIGSRKEMTKQFDHSFVVYEAEKCIRCGLCVDIASSEKDALGLTFIGRGFNVRVQVPFNAKLEDALKTTALKCIESCPTGALAKII